MDIVCVYTIQYLVNNTIYDSEPLLGCYCFQTLQTGNNNNTKTFLICLCKFIHVEKTPDLIEFSDTKFLLEIF